MANRKRHQTINKRNRERAEGRRTLKREPRREAARSGEALPPSVDVD